ncbi:hypothetical protein GQX74_005981, partial [Glossina fuscipes]
EKKKNRRRKQDNHIHIRKRISTEDAHQSYYYLIHLVTKSKREKLQSRSSAKHMLCAIHKFHGHRIDSHHYGLQVNFAMQFKRNHECLRVRGKNTYNVRSELRTHALRRNKVAVSLKAAAAERLEEITNVVGIVAMAADEADEIEGRRRYYCLKVDFKEQTTSNLADTFISSAAENVFVLLSSIAFRRLYYI